MNQAKDSCLDISVQQASDFTTQEKLAESGLYVYNTTSKNRGIVKVINFMKINGFEARDGSEIDVKNLTAVFRLMGFIVEVHPTTNNSPTNKEIETSLYKFVQDERLKQFDIAIIFIMSHGDRENGRDFFYTADGKTFDYDQVRRIFDNRNCKFMQNKPKLLFIQACRGDNLDPGTRNTLQYDGNPRSEVLMASLTDFLLVHATTPDFRAARWTHTGSVFINHLCDEFMRNACKFDVSNMLTNVYRRMASERIDDGNCFQTGEFTSTAFGLCYLNPGIYRDNLGVIRCIFTDEEISQLDTAQNSSEVLPLNTVALDNATSPVVQLEHKTHRHTQYIDENVVIANMDLVRNKIVEANTANKLTPSCSSDSLENIATVNIKNELKPLQNTANIFPLSTEATDNVTSPVVQVEHNTHKSKQYNDENVLIANMNVVINEFDEKLATNKITPSCSSDSPENISTAKTENVQMPSQNIADCCKLQEFVADVMNVRMKNETTFLHVAAQKGHLNCCIKLIHAAYEIDAKDLLNATPLHYAALNGHSECCKLLLNAGANVNQRGTNNNTPLHNAAEKGHPNCCKALVDANANLNAKTIYGFTPLHYAAQHLQLECCRVLLEAGANIRAQDRYGNTATNFAYRWDNLSCYDFLKSKEDNS